MSLDGNASLEQVVNMPDPNPYASPTSAFAPDAGFTIPLDPADQRKIDAIIKDAGQFWLAIILCILCSAIGALIIPIWYLVRLLQWNSFSKKYPALLTPGAQPGSLPAKFQAAQWKLIVGLVVGALVFLFLIAYVVLLIVVGVNMNP